MKALRLTAKDHQTLLSQVAEVRARRDALQASQETLVGVFSDMIAVLREAQDERSEAWQDSDKGVAVEEWLTALEELCDRMEEEVELDWLDDVEALDPEPGE